MKSIIFLLFFWSQISPASSPPCQQVRAVFDLGSGTTKMLVAKVDQCQRKLIKILTSKKIPLGYMEALEHSNSGGFSPEIMKAGIAALTNLKDQASKHGASQYFGVATAAFRKAKNASSFLTKISHQLDIHIRVISARTEAKLGYYAVQYSLGNSQISVWDIGGGSMQIVTGSASGKLDIHLIPFGAVSFKTQVLNLLNRHPLASPNPIGKLSAQSVKQLARQIAGHYGLNGSVVQNKVFGIGGVHNQSVAKQVGKPSYTFQELSELLKKKSLLGDDKIDSKFAATEVTNLALVSGFMETMEIAQVHTIDKNLTDALIYLKNVSELSTVAKP